MAAGWATHRQFKQMARWLSLLLFLVVQAGCGVTKMQPAKLDIGTESGFDGTVIDVETGAAVANARVTVRSSRDSAAYFETYSDVQGKFSIRYLRKGQDQIAFVKGDSYGFAVSSTDYRTFRRPETFKGKVQQVKIGLTRFQDTVRKPDAPVPPPPDRTLIPQFRAGPPIP